MKINALYVSTQDFDRGVRCYTELVFQRPPAFTTERFAFFDIDGFLFGVFNAAFADEAPTVGSNCVPTIEVENVDEVYQRLADAGLETVMQPHFVEGMRIAQVLDTEGNTLEFYTQLQKSG